MAKTRIGALTELVVMLTVIMAYGAIARPDDPFLLQAKLHPFWAPLLLVALRYGSPTGIIVGIICAALHGFGLWLTGLDLGEALHLDAGAIMGLLLYVVVGAVVGESSEQAMRRAEFLRAQAGELHNRLSACEGQRAGMEKAYRTVEGRVASQTKTAITLYDSVKNLDSLDPRDIYLALTEALREQLGVEEGGVWLPTGAGGFNRIAPAGAEQGELPELGRMALHTGRVITAREIFADQDRSPADGLVAGPLFAGESRVVGLVVVQKMRFTGFTPSAVKQFEILLDWASRMLARASRFASVERRAVFDTTLDLTSELYLRTRVKAELSLGKRRGSPAAACGGRRA